MDAVPNWVARYFAERGGELVIGDVPVTRLVARHGTPVFVYDRAVLDRKLDALRAALPAGFFVCYSVKANPNRALLEHFLSRGCGLELASAGEFHQALAAGAKPGELLFAGPGKTEAELELVLKHSIGEIHAESELEIKRIGTICRRLGCRARVAIRVNPSGEAQGGAMRMGGKPLPFGVDEERLDSVLDLVLAERSIDFHGIHLFAGTQVLEAEVLAAQYRKGLAIAAQVAERLGGPLHTIDFGGGLGIPYFVNAQPLDLEKLHSLLAGLFAEFAGDRRFAGTQFVVEPGRFLVGEAGVYLCRVNDIKESRGKKFLIVDGGMHHHLAASGNLGQTIKRNYPVAIVNKLDKPAGEAVEVVGPLCTPLDVLARNIQLPRAEVGDIVGVFQSGAYARAASPLNFLSHPAPPEVLTDRGEDRLIRTRGEYADYLVDQTSTVVPR